MKPKDIEKLKSATDIEAEAPSLTGKALDEYVAQNAEIASPQRICWVSSSTVRVTLKANAGGSPR